MGGWAVAPQPQSKKNAIHHLASASDSELERKHTIAAYAPDLTCISAPELLPGEGNIHSGAPAPWLLDDTDTVEQPQSVKTTSIKKQKPALPPAAEPIANQIPPSQPSISTGVANQIPLSQPSISQPTPSQNIPAQNSQVYIQGAEQRSVSKGTIPSKTQGSFSEGSGSADWLPRFGRVFNAGPRSDTRKEFLREISEDKTQSSGAKLGVKPGSLAGIEAQKQRLRDKMAKR
mmetsp:Transcript_46152/g.76889  ORF Transcript_46152/g.76889 Transcript_46152/m.76889 type:complete len:232 (+) Transcript_46152:761-1456(+)